MYICPVNKKLAQNDNEYGHALISIESFISSGSFRLSPLNLPLDAKWLCIVETMSCGQRLRDIHTAKFVAAAEDATLVYLD